MEVRPQIDRVLMSASFQFAAFVLVGGCLLLYHRSETVLLIGGTLTLFLVFARPVLGLALYLLIYPLVPAEESISLLKVGVFALTVLLLLVWTIQKVVKEKTFLLKREYISLYLLFIFLCLSPLLGVYNGFTPTDWARDIAPMLNLLLLPIMVHYFSRERHWWLPHVAFVPLGLGVLRDILVLLGSYGVSFGALESLEGLPFASIHPSIGLALGLTMYLHKVRGKKYWFSLAVMSLVATFLTPTRTVWITTGTMVALFVVFKMKRRLWVAGSIALLAGAIGWLVIFSTTPGLYIESQRERFEGLKNYSEDLSAQNRIEEMEQAGELFLSSPIYGVGFGYQYDFWRPFVTDIGPGYIDTNFTHSDIMFIASKGGIFGLLFWGLMLYALGKKLFFRMKNATDAVQSAWATIGLLALINSLIIGLSTPVFQTRSAMFVLVVLLAMGLVQRDDGKARTFNYYRQLQR